MTFSLLFVFFPTILVHNPKPISFSSLNCTHIRPVLTSITLRHSRHLTSSMLFSSYSSSSFYHMHHSSFSLFLYFPPPFSFLITSNPPTPLSPISHLSSLSPIPYPLYIHSDTALFPTHPMAESVSGP